MIEPEFVFHLTKAQSLGASENASALSADARHRLRLGENKDVELDPSFELIYVPQEKFTTPMNPRYGAMELSIPARQIGEASSGNSAEMEANAPYITAAVSEHHGNRSDCLCLQISDVLIR
jgi:hypothetical protein